MSTLNTTTVATRPTTLNNTTDVGKSYFETDTNNIVVWDGTNWRGYQNDGLTFGGTSYVAELNGTNQYLTLGDVRGTLGGASKCSVSWWMKQPTFSSGTGFVRAFQTGDDQSNGLLVLWNHTYWYIAIGGGDPRGYVVVNTSGTPAVDDNQWHLWTVVYDGTQSSNTTKVVLYRDTTPQTMGLETTGTIATSLPSGAGDEPHIGVFYATQYQSTPFQFSDASFDDFAIVDDALTSTQISNIYNNQIYPSSLKHLYRFENNVNDSVGGTNFNGTAVNSPITNNPSSPQFPY